MKRYEIDADITYYTNDDMKLYGKFIGGVDANSLLSALRWFDLQTNQKALLFGAHDYFVVPMYIGKEQNELSRKYYREVVFNDDDLWKHWCC